MQGISIVTGTLNRREYLKDLLRNTVESDERLELVLVDGGSTDGTIETLEDINHPRVKLVKYGERSPYPHYMNLGIQNASHELVCQWNDDVLLVNDWDDVFNEIDEEHDAYLFNWKEGSLADSSDPQWLKCDRMRDNGWIICNNADFKYPQMTGEKTGEVVMNYGVYKKDVFRQHGLYNRDYQYYCADGEMSMRAYYAGVKFKTCTDIKVCVLPAEKRAIMVNEDLILYTKHCTYYTLPRSITGCSIGKMFNGEYL
jgi:glycosyltransferase involved in cell wall biosynthesis